MPVPKKFKDINSKVKQKIRTRMDKQKSENEDAHECHTHTQIDRHSCIGGARERSKERG